MRFGAEDCIVYAQHAEIRCQNQLPRVSVQLRDVVLQRYPDTVSGRLHRCGGVTVRRRLLMSGVRGDTQVNSRRAEARTGATQVALETALFSADTEGRLRCGEQLHAVTWKPRGLVGAEFNHAEDWGYTALKSS